ncbi:ATP-binding protein [Actinomadura litoris]|uniref:ATP-binding protein n=1 Tax=Actinomadura litoris TaxID=2678616 RepID=A0A7K1KT69_9ACTN|nr:ATP-binding protein [Actinomadura litoris]MUN35369.1 ATP-binding protein [Actinomadura litoris]
MEKLSRSRASALAWMSGAEPMRWRRAYPGRADQVHVARNFVTALCEGTGREADVAAVVSELAANAIRHSRSGGEPGWFGMEVMLDEIAYVGVTDLGGGCVPTIRSETPNCEPRVSGYGLLTVSKLASAIGVYGSPTDGFTVWAELALCRPIQAAPQQSRLLAS